MAVLYGAFKKMVGRLGEISTVIFLADSQEVQRINSSTAEHARRLKCLIAVPELQTKR